MAVSPAPTMASTLQAPCHAATNPAATGISPKGNATAAREMSAVEIIDTLSDAKLIAGCVTPYVEPEDLYQLNTSMPSSMAVTARFHGVVVAHKELSQVVASDAMLSHLEFALTTSHASCSSSCILVVVSQWQEPSESRTRN